MAVSQNGWPVIPTYSDSRLVSNPVVPGTGASLDGGILAGDVFTVLMWVARRFHETVEPLIDGQCWGYEPRPIRGSTEWSNHASGTCIDLNSVRHGLGASGTFSSAQVGAIRAILSACGGLVRWGGDYSGRKDEMHFEIVGSAGEVAGLAARLGRQPGKPNTPSTPNTPPADTPGGAQRGILMALSDAQQDELYRWVKDLVGKVSFIEQSERIPVDDANPSKGSYPFTRSAANFNDVREIGKVVDSIKGKVDWLLANERIPLDGADPSKGDYPFTKSAATFDDVRRVEGKLDALIAASTPKA